MARRADDFANDSLIDVVNPEDDTSTEAIAAWIADLERDDDWIELGSTAAELPKTALSPARERSRPRRVGSG